MRQVDLSLRQDGSDMLDIDRIEAMRRACRFISTDELDLLPEAALHNMIIFAVNLVGKEQRREQAQR